VLSMTVLSGELSVSTDRMIASLRAQEPVRLVDRRRHSARRESRRGAVRTRSVEAPGSSSRKPRG
jgi:hypothetical protein